MSKETRIGALWTPESKSDKAPLAKGNILLPNGEKMAIVIWKNIWKQDGERTPDYYIEQDVKDPRTERADAPAPAQREQARRLSPFPSDERPGMDAINKKRQEEAAKYESKEAKQTDLSDDIPF
jgi:hypothetical protein